MLYAFSSAFICFIVCFIICEFCDIYERRRYRYTLNDWYTYIMSFTIFCGICGFCDSYDVCAIEMDFFRNIRSLLNLMFFVEILIFASIIIYIHLMRAYSRKYYCDS